MSANWNWLQDLRVTGRARPGAGHARLLRAETGRCRRQQRMGRQTAADVVAAGGTAVIIGQHPGKVDDTVKTLARDGKAYGITADLADREQVERVRRELADEHADATLLVNSAGLFVPKPFLDYDGASYDSYLSWTGRSSSSPRRWPAAWSRTARAGPSSTSQQSPRPSPPPRPRGTGGQGRLARLHPEPGHRAGPVRDPGQRGGPGRRRHPHLRTLRPQGQARGDPAQLRRLPPARPGRHPRDLANTITFLLSRPPAGSPAPSGTSTAASWPDATDNHRRSDHVEPLQRRQPQVPRRRCPPRPDRPVRVRRPR